MKKIIIGFAVFMMSVVGAKAQDTVVLNDIRDLSRYMIGDEFPYYPSEFEYGPDGKTHTAYLLYHSSVNRGQDLKVGYRFMTDDTLEVLGIAAALFSSNDYLNWEIYPGEDTSSYYAYTWLMLFDAVGDSLVELVDTSYMYVHAWQRPSYYLRLNFSFPYMEPLRAVPIHERYFPSPVTVTDSFYLGQIPWQGHEISTRADISLGAFSALDGTGLEPRPTVEKCLAMVYDPSTGEMERMWHCFGWWFGHPMIFPILAPPDTTGGGSDTTGVGIGTPEWAARYVSVSPNPASDRVQVVSSFGLADVEVFDAKGQRICSKKASGYKCTLDVASWPRGAYVVRIGTDVGTVAKKLLLK